MDLLNSLMTTGLTSYEAKVYLALHTEGPLSGYEAAKVSGISRSNVYMALAGLVDKGAAHTIEGATTRYTPVPVGEFFDNKIRQLQEMKQILIENMPERREDTTGYITVTGEKHILDKVKNMLVEAKQRVYLATSGKTLESILPDLEGVLSRGCKLVIITNPPFELSGAIVYHANKPDHQIRLIVDSENVLTGELTGNNSSSCLYSKKKNLIDLFKESMKNEIKLIELIG